MPRRARAPHITPTGMRSIGDETDVDARPRGPAGFFQVRMSYTLTQRLSKGACVMVTDVWGHYHSRIVDDNAVISHWARNHPDE